MWGSAAESRGRFWAAHIADGPGRLREICGDLVRLLVCRAVGGVDALSGEGRRCQGRNNQGCNPACKSRGEAEGVHL
jgi:hypothetical protein